MSILSPFLGLKDTRETRNEQRDRITTERKQTRKNGERRIDGLHSSSLSLCLFLRLHFAGLSLPFAFVFLLCSSVTWVTLASNCFCFTSLPACSPSFSFFLQQTIMMFTLSVSSLEWTLSSLSLYLCVCSSDFLLLFSSYSFSDVGDSGLELFLRYERLLLGTQAQQ